MKKTIYTIILFAFASIAYAQNQTFTLTPKGFVNSADSTKDFIVLNFEGKKLEDIYKQTLIYMNKYYKSPKEVISSVPNETVTVRGLGEEKIKEGNFPRKPFDIKYTIVFSFKDGKVRIDAPSFDLISLNGNFREMFLVGSGFSTDGTKLWIYNKKGDLKRERAKSDLEAFFIKYFDDYANGILDSNGKSDW